MAVSYFSVENSSALQVVPPGGRIHVIGVCGVAMAQMSVVLSELGYIVTGSDKEYYEPMKSFLGNSKVKTFLGFDAAHLDDAPHLVLIGNSISVTNVEVIAVEEKKLPYTFFPKLLSETVIQERHSIAVCGTHGKTTTTALNATVLTAAGKNPSYFIGGAAKGLDRSLVIDSGSVSVVEGDEYDSAFFAKVPKFFFYKPKTAIITSLEYDHADIYPNLESIIEVFSKMVHGVPKDGLIICCIDCPNLKKLVPEWQKTALAPIMTYGTAPEADVQIESRSFSGMIQQIHCRLSAGTITLQLPAIGLHNARNAVATYLACTHAGVSSDAVVKGLQTFKGVKRRQDVRADKNGITLIEDFAHHPTAVHETLGAIREQFIGRRIIAVFEPRSNTSRRKVFQKQYVDAFGSADLVVLSAVTGRDSDKGQELMNVSDLAEDIASLGKESVALDGTQAIFEHVKVTMKSGDVIVVMSNGSFGGLIDLLERALS